MKKFLGMSLFLLAMQFGNAQTQTFKPFKVDASLGYASPQGKGAKGGILIAIEPKYSIMDQIAVGIRLESAFTAAATTDANGNVTPDSDFEVKGHGSYLATGDYYFTNTKFRPFAGTGMGLYRNAGVSTKDLEENPDAETVEVKTSNKFGFMLRGGFELGHFRTGLEYNFVGNKNGYLGLKMGFCIGGGRFD